MVLFSFNSKIIRRASIKNKIKVRKQSKTTRYPTWENTSKWKRFVMWGAKLPKTAEAARTLSEGLNSQGKGNLQ